MREEAGSLDRPWEPRQLHLGQRVVVRIRPECFCFDIRRGDDREPAENGHSGIITDLHFDPVARGLDSVNDLRWRDHRIWVELDGDSDIEATALCISEIEPLGGAPDA